MAAASRTGVSGAELVHRVFELINSHDIAGLTEHVWTHEMVERFPDRTCHGPHELGRYFAELFAAAPDLHMELLVIAKRVRDGKVASNFVVFDQMQWARQIGLLPPDGSGADKALKGAYNARTKLLARLGR